MVKLTKLVEDISLMKKPIHLQILAQLLRPDAPKSSDSDHEEELHGQIVTDIRVNINHKPVKVLRSQSPCPFTTMAHEGIFFRC